MLSRRQRLRRTAIVCLHCLRNFAFFRPMRDLELDIQTRQFWVVARNNFLDTGILEWCKVLADPKGKHFWRKTVTDQDAFMLALLQRLNCSQAEFDDYITAMRAYRDKFLAHLDEENDMDIRALDMAIHSTQFLYQHLIDHENDCDAFRDDPPLNAAAFYDRFLVEGRAVTRAAGL